MNCNRSNATCFGAFWVLADAFRMPRSETLRLGAERVERYASEYSSVTLLAARRILSAVGTSTDEQWQAIHEAAAIIVNNALN